MILTPRPIKLIVFDFDGVLVDTQRTVNKLEWAHLLKHVMKMTLTKFTERFSGQTALLIERLRKERNIESFFPRK